MPGVFPDGTSDDPTDDPAGARRELTIQQHVGATGQLASATSGAAPLNLVGARASQVQANQTSLGDVKPPEQVIRELQTRAGEINTPEQNVPYNCTLSCKNAKVARIAMLWRAWYDAEHKKISAPFQAYDDAIQATIRKLDASKANPVSDFFSNPANIVAGTLAVVSGGAAAVTFGARIAQAIQGAGSIDAAMQKLLDEAARNAQAWKVAVASQLGTDNPYNFVPPGCTETCRPLGGVTRTRPARTRIGNGPYPRGFVIFAERMALGLF